MVSRMAIVGAGPMGTAIAVGLRACGAPFLVEVAEVDDERRRILRQRHDVPSQPRIALDRMDWVVLAVQPQSFAAFAAGCDGVFGPHHRVISVMAGISVDTIGRLLGTRRVIRAIPNIPAEVSQAMTVMCADPAVDGRDIATAQEILGSVGRVLHVEDEALIDAATALCGGGPAFVAHLAGAMQDFAVASGFTTAQARVMVAQVLRGTAQLLDATDRSPAEICTAVMTPNGTTERGMSAIRAAGVGTALIDALRRSADRSRELNTIAAVA